MLLKSAGDCRYHWCPACEQTHPIPPQGWTFNGSLDRPSFEPSFKQTFFKAIGNQVDRPRGEERVCHYFIRDATIQFCPDSWHGRSDIVAMPSIPDEVVAHLDRMFNEE